MRRAKDPLEQGVRRIGVPDEVETHNRSTWLGPYAAAWRQVFGSDCMVPWGQLARWLAPLHRRHGAPEVSARLGRYLHDAQQYVSLPKFAATFGLWAKKKGDVQYLTAADLDLPT